MICKGQITLCEICNPNNMRIQFFILLLLFSPFFNGCNNPSLEDTEKWIKHAIESHPADFPFAGGNSYIFKVQFLEGGIMEIREIYSNSESNTTFNVIYEVPIKKMKKPTINHRYSEWPVSVILINPIYSNDFHNFIVKSCRDDWTVEREGKTNEVGLFLNVAMPDENIDERLIEAFNHLIELHRGEPVKEVF